MNQNYRSLFAPPVTFADLLAPEAPEITIGLGDLVAAYIGNQPEPCFGNVIDTCLSNFADNGRNWYKVDFGFMALWLTDEDDYAALRLVLKASALQ